MNKNAHFIGICGIAMGSVAVMLQEMGWTVTGSDSGFYDPMYSYLKEKGINFASEHSPRNIPAEPDLIIIGRHAKLVPETNDEVAEAFAKFSDKIKSFPEVIGEFMKTTENFMVVGSYGKSTTTSILVWCLVHAGKDPSYLIGGISPNLGQSSHKGQDELFIIEGDEYPSANFDSTSKFLHYPSKNLILTAGEHDHINVFPTIDSYHEPFIKLLQSLPNDGLLVGAIDEPYVVELMENTHCKKVSYGFTTAADWHISDIVFGEITTFNLNTPEKIKIPLRTKLLGKHNLQNIAGVGSILLTKGIITAEEFQLAIAEFSGLVRRLDRKTSNKTIPVYEGYGTSYTKARTAIEAMKLHFPEKRLVVVFEPHTFSWRNKEALASWYPTAFLGVDELLITPPPEHGKNTHEQITLESIISTTKESGVSTTAVMEPGNAIDWLKSNANNSDIILLLSSGDLGGLINLIPEWCEENLG